MNYHKINNRHKPALLSGGVAGTLASCITNPLEVIKTQLQSTSTSVFSQGGMSSSSGKPLAVARKIIEEDGIAGFWRGMPPTLVGIIPARSAYFYAYEKTKRFLASSACPIKLEEGGTYNALIAGLAAGVAGNTLTNPIWLVKTRMQLLADNTAGQTAYTGYRDAIRTIYHQEGIAGFYKGIFASYWGCTEGCIQFILYEKLKTKQVNAINAEREAQGLAPMSNPRLSKLQYFCTAACAKGVAAIATYPHEVARTRLREQARSGVFKYHGMWQTLGLIAKEEGRQGLYAGMGVHLMKVVPNSAIMFLTYEIVNSWLDQFTVVD
eukprot:CAMPEP_0178944064 /NCGR_PEP_ID=MMETSP0789-20121207/2936_1 /TAXON_ID=3005 /ORGANISM="Rhizosolenia setigera, Strain CCMP 1694" /LENGTH=322 /DNA_ID=CAMNT_0020623731 /DNA_START=281 /DNA_END=1248 /DNA_ORIENTATION=+